MGFFSNKCEGCHRSILSTFSEHYPASAWMTDCVAITPTGEVVTGLYDGYGNVGDLDPAPPYFGTGKNRAFLGATVWHRACWEVAGSPTDFRGESEMAQDQGYFFDPKKYLQRDPRKPAPAKKAAARKK